MSPLNVVYSSLDLMQQASQTFLMPFAFFVTWRIRKVVASSVQSNREAASHNCVHYMPANTHP